MAYPETLRDVVDPLGQDIIAQQELARGLRASAASAPRRPDIGELYGKLETLQGTPIDYSKVEQFNKGKIAAARRDALAGLALGMFGGERLGRYGEHIFKQALGDMEPIRPNLADVGYTNPETGEFIENPAMARGREEKLITGRIDALTREREHEINQLLAEGRIEEARQRAAELKEYRDALLAQGDRRLGQQASNAAAKAAKADEPKFVPGLQGLKGGQQVPVYRMGDQYTTSTGEPLDSAPMSVAETTKATQQLKTDFQGYVSAKQLAEEIKKNEKAFGFVAGTLASSSLPQAVKSWGQSIILTPEQQQLRAQVFSQAAERVKELYGVAQSRGESGRMEQFLIVEGDSPETARNKLLGAIKEYERMLAAQRASSKITSSPSSVPVGEVNNPLKPVTPAGPPPGAVRRKTK